MQPINCYEFDYTMDDKPTQLVKLVNDAWKHNLRIKIKEENTFATDYVVLVKGTEDDVYAFILENYDENYDLGDMRELNQTTYE